MGAMCQPWRVTNTPVCVVGLGLIGGSVMRAAAAAGREVFGYNRSIDAVQAAKFDGFDATENLDKALARAAEGNALIVLSVPVPALPLMLGYIRDFAPKCPLTDVTSVKSAVLEEVQSFGLLERFVGGHPMAGTAHSGWSAGNPRLFVGAPWVISVDDHVEADVWTMVMNLALDCGSVVVPARSDEHDAAAATSRTCRICSPRRSRSPLARFRWRSRWPPARSATAPGSRPPRRIWCAPCARRTPTSCCPSWSAPS